MTGRDNRSACKASPLDTAAESFPFLRSSSAEARSPKSLAGLGVSARWLDGGFPEAHAAQHKRGDQGIVTPSRP